jgi:hypothetical protein
MDCIPVVIKNDIYDCWSELPILQVEDYSELTYEKMGNFANRVFNHEKMHLSFWRQTIQKAFDEIR